MLRGFVRSVAMSLDSHPLASTGALKLFFKLQVAASTVSRRAIPKTSKLWRLATVFMFVDSECYGEEWKRGD